jgi:hypothetical protein
MPIPVQRLPPPQLDRSQVPYTVTMVNRICDALLKAFGGDFQTGIATQAAVGLVNIGFNVSFPSVFNHTDGPVVLITPTGNADQWICNVGFSNNNAFSIFASTQTGGAATGNFNARWVAWYP